MQIFSLSSPNLCIQKAKEILYKEVDSKTVLFLSGGETPKSLYEILAKEEIIMPAAAGMVDERFGKKWHEKSNERMIKETGLLKYLEYAGVPWYPILQNDFSHSEKWASSYDSQLRELLFHFPKSVAVLGVGADGHTAGIPAGNPASNLFQGDDLVVSYNDTSGIYGQRITMTFTALSMIDNLVILAFGKDKNQALGKMFTPGSWEEIPARFYNKPEITKKVILITDQNI